MKFPNKTAFELRQYFSQLSLAQLTVINISYGPHFERLEERIECCNSNLTDKKARLARLIQERKDAQQTYEAVEIREAEYQKILASVLADSSRTNRFLGRQAMGDSPMVLFKLELAHLDADISIASEDIQEFNATLDALNQKKKGAISEFRILESVRDEKKRYAFEETQTAQSKIS
ncbi:MULTISPECIES: hypothetical protein [Legionella]|uniref:Uncharacterized protein n=1 Tax=Legionella steelei TaxID=947033 RepID=A0A0W0ZJA4_9GAMM|nr:MULTISPECIES: hypothetical protein [Legionella]KTD69114.1 hypothetical protein Lste_2272 [Legionella steelei]MBN9225764.1 hypothetical protein [Legionella steelei]OJW10626.1 MAG: hypothetical protein BGO44_05515 [Legionella sp. 39-23]